MRILTSGYHTVSVNSLGNVSVNSLGNKMNERIGKLRIEACKWARENVPVGEYENASDEKFAELIVL